MGVQTKFIQLELACKEMAKALDCNPCEIADTLFDKCFIDLETRNELITIFNEEAG